LRKRYDRAPGIVEFLLTGWCVATCAGVLIYGALNDYLSVIVIGVLGATYFTWALISAYKIYRTQALQRQQTKEFWRLTSQLLGGQIFIQIAFEGKRFRIVDGKGVLNKRHIGFWEESDLFDARMQGLGRIFVPLNHYWATRGFPVLNNQLTTIELVHSRTTEESEFFTVQAPPGERKEGLISRLRNDKVYRTGIDFPSTAEVEELLQMLRELNANPSLE
jgi:hypothetical protein